MARSKSYVGTFDVNSASDMIELDKIRKEIIPAVNAKTSKKVRLVLRGRKPINKLEINTLPHGSCMVRKRVVSYDYFGNIVGGLKNATQLDAYIYRR